MILSGLMCFELLLSQFVFSVDNCDVNEKGHELHSFSSYQFFFYPDKNGSQISAEDIFSSFNTKDGLDNNISDFLAFGNDHNQTRIERTVNFDKHMGGLKSCTLFPTLRILLVLMVIFEGVRLAFALANLLKKRRRKRVAQNALLKHSRTRQHAIPDLPGIQGGVILPVPSQVIDATASTSRETSSRPQNSLDEIQVLPAKQNDATPGLASFALAPLHPFAPESFASSNVPPPSTVAVIDSTAVDNAEATGTNNEVSDAVQDIKKTLVILIRRAYSLIIIFCILYLCSFLLPVKLYFMRQTRLQVTVFKLDIFFVPMFWILVDKDILHFTERKIKNMFRSVRHCFMDL